MISNKVRLERLKRLYDVVRLHYEAKGKPVKLNGVSRIFNMRAWDCGTSACALGSYALTPYGKKYWKWIDDPELLNHQFKICVLKSHLVKLNKDINVYFDLKESEEYAAIHFGITDSESKNIFMDIHATASKTLFKIQKLIDNYSGY